MPKHRTLQERIEFVGTSLYGATGWTTRLAAGLSMSRSQLFEWRRGSPKTIRRDVDGELIALIDRERAEASARGLMLSRLRSRLRRMTGRSGRDAA